MADGGGDGKKTMENQEGDGCGFAALLKRKQRKNSDDEDAERDGTSVATAESTISLSSREDVSTSEEETTVVTIPE